MFSFSLKSFIHEFRLPLVILGGIILYFFLQFLGQSWPAIMIVLFVTGLGSYGLVKETIESLFKGEYVLDYIAILAIVVSLITGEYLVASIIALMLSSGRTLEAFGANSAKKALVALVDRIPSEVVLWEGGRAEQRIKIKDVQVGDEVLVRKGEVIALDGNLVSEKGLTDESSLTGEPYEMEKFKGDSIRSGTVNIGEVIVVRVTKTQKNSTYNQIIEMVKKAQGEKAPLVRLADRYSVVFTVITLLISGLAYFLSQDLVRVLAVLVVATPCPLILATPIALIGGVNAAAKKRTIIKKLASIEVLSRINVLVFDKTGTITLGVPAVVNFKILDKSVSRQKILAIAEAIERNSLHPLAKAIVRLARDEKTSTIIADEITEIIGQGIAGKINGKKYLLSKINSDTGMSISLKEGNKEIAIFEFEDQIKEESRQIVGDLKKQGYLLYIFTGDKKLAAEKVVERLGENVVIRAGLTPEQKQAGIEELKKQGKVVAMVGDGINDAPALALSDVGMVFSNEEQTAASEAADIVFLGGDFEHVTQSIDISKKTVKIALQSIVWGIGASSLAMVLASFGFIPPIIGAGLQEAIDVAVIINALRSSRI